MWVPKLQTNQTKCLRNRLALQILKHAIILLPSNLESTDMAGRMPHPRPTRLDTGHGVRRGCPHIGATSEFFFFFSSDSHQLGSIRTDAARFVPNRLQFAPNRADSAKIRPYLPYRVVAAGDQYGRYGRNRPWIWPEKPKFSPYRHSNVFLAFFFLCFVN